MKIIRYSFLPFLAILCVPAMVALVSRHPVISLAFSTPDRKVEGPSVSGLTISVQRAPVPLFFGSEKHRRLVVCDGSIHCTSAHLIADFSRRVNLYRHINGSIVIVNDIWMMELRSGPGIRIFDMHEEERTRLRETRWDCGETGPLAHSDPPNSVYFKNMKFLGAFSIIGAPSRPLDILFYRSTVFLPSTTHGEKLCRYPSRG